MKKFGVFLLVVLSVFSFSACKKQDNLAELGKNLSTYSMDIELNTQEKRAAVREKVNYVNNTGSIIKQVKFHLYPQFFKAGANQTVVSSNKMNDAYPNGMSYAEFDVLRVLVGSEECAVNYSGEHDGILTVDLITSLTPNNSVDIFIDFNFKLPNCEHRFGYGQSAINVANFYPIACVYENGAFNENGYNANGDPFYSDMANYYVNITLDDGYTVAASGDEIKRTTDENKQTISYEGHMIRDFAFVVSNKFSVATEKLGDTTINYYYYDDENPSAALKAGVDAIKTFSNLFGEYPYKTFNIVKTNFIYGGMEYPNLILISDDVVDSADYLNVIVHETAHQWWYGMVGNDEFTLPWLDEALTEYSSILFYDYNEGYELNHKDMVKANYENYKMFLTAYTDVLGDMDTSMRAVNEYATEPEYTYCTYVKGVLMFDSLYNLVGEKKFVKSLKTYFDENKYTNATAKDLINAFEKTCKTDLTGFFDSWLNGKVIIR